MRRIFKRRAVNKSKLKTPIHYEYDSHLVDSLTRLEKTFRSPSFSFNLCTSIAISLLVGWIALFFLAGLMMGHWEVLAVITCLVIPTIGVLTYLGLQQASRENRGSNEEILKSTLLSVPKKLLYGQLGSFEVDSWSESEDRVRKAYFTAGGHAYVITFSYPHASLTVTRDG